MATYVESALGEGERVLYIARLSYWPYAGRFLAAFACLFLPLAGLPLWTMLACVPVFAACYLRLDSVEIGVTNRRVIVKTGIMSRATSELYLNRVEGIEVEQTTLERMLDFGTVNIRGVGTEIAPVSHIANPLAFRKAFYNAVDAVMAEGGELRHPEDASPRSAPRSARGS